jgi:hypothetical protein
VATSAEDRRRMGVMEMKRIRVMREVSIMYIVRNEEVWRRCGSELSVGERMDINVLRRYGDVERMEEDRVVKRVYTSKLEGS